MSQVFVLDTTKQPLHPVHPGRARLFLKQGKASVYRGYPFCVLVACSDGYTYQQGKETAFPPSP